MVGTAIMGAVWTVAAFWLTKEMIPVLLLTAHKYQLYDLPDGERKLHLRTTPTLGGIAIFLSVAIAYSFMVGFLSLDPATLDMAGFGFFVAASILLFGIGLKDDVIGVSAKYKISAQLIASVFVTFGLGLQIHSLGGLFGIHEIPSVIGILLTIFTIIVLINAYNLIDGVDGLAGGIAVIASLFFGTWFLMVDYLSLAIFSFILSASIAGFLRFNMSPARIFMGDTGSLLIGFFLAIQAIAFVNLGLVHEDVVYWQPAVPVLAMAVLIVPMYDTLRVFLIRAFRKQSPFTPDRSHLHHLLQDLGCSARQTTFLLWGFTVAFTGVALLLALVLNTTQLFFALLSLALLCLPTYFWKTRLLKRFRKKDPITVYLNQVQEEMELQLKEIEQEQLEEVEAAEEEREAELV